MLLSKSASLTASQIAEIIIRDRHCQKWCDWILVEELRLGCGFKPGQQGFIDLWAMEASASKGCPSVAYEIKVSTVDFRRDIKKPTKQHGALMFSDEFFYVAPEGIIPRNELPPWAGLIEIRDTEDGPKCFTAVQATAWGKGQPTWPFLVSLIRRVPHAFRPSRLSAEMRGTGESLDWVGKFLNRRAAVEGKLAEAGKNGGLTPEQCKGLARELGVPIDIPPEA
jgi:hypothetical protein